MLSQIRRFKRTAIVAARSAIAALPHEKRMKVHGFARRLSRTDRVEELRRHIRVSSRGIEIGPFHNPITSRRAGYNCVVLDIFSSAELRRRAEQELKLPPDQVSWIEDVDLVGSACDIADLVRAKYGDEMFDYVVSSHNLEHLPDPLRFLQGCATLLKPGGVVSMAIPDRRYCFDFYRPVTELSEWLDAWHEKRTKPTAAQVFRDLAMTSVLDDQLTWSRATAGIPTPLDRLEASYEEWKRLVENKESAYQDAHCWAFTPSSLALMLSDASHLGLVDLVVLDVSRTNGHEFYVHLEGPRPDRRLLRGIYYQASAVLMRSAAAENIGRQ